MSLDFAGDDITEFLNTLLFRTGFPYREIDLNRWTDFTMMEDLKEKMVVLSEVRPLSPIRRLSLTLYDQSDVGLNMYDFYVRNPGKPTRKYTFRSYDDVILAPYVCNRSLEDPFVSPTDTNHLAVPVCTPNRRL